MNDSKDHKAACSSVPLVGQLVLDIGCPLTQEMRRFNPDGFPEIERLR